MQHQQAQPVTFARGTPVGRLLRVAGSRTRRGGRTRPRRGVAAILAMMFLVMFGSLTAAMAIASRGNVTTASTTLHVGNAQAAAETGLQIASRQLADTVNRFRIANEVDAARLWSLWRMGGNGFDSAVDRVMPLGGGAPSASGMSMVQALGEMMNLYTESGSKLAPSDFAGSLNAATVVARPNVANQWPTAIYMDGDFLQTPVYVLRDRRGAAGSPREGEFTGTGYQVMFAPLRVAPGNSTEMDTIRIIVTGYDFGRVSRVGGQGTAREPIARTVMQDFRLSKRVDQAIVSPARIMLGKNVQVTGDMGVLYGSDLVGQIRSGTATGAPFKHADPLLAISDFGGLAPELDQRLRAFYQALQGFSATTGDFQNGVPRGDFDNRIALEPGATLNTVADLAQQNFNSAVGGTPGPGQLNAFRDATGDGYIDEFDVFINYFDTGGPSGTPDRRVTRSEFTLDAALFDLIDSTNPDRNRDGTFGFLDLNANGVRDDFGPSDPRTEPFMDQVRTGVATDNSLGYLDGVIDARDRYAKVNGRLLFRVGSTDWNNALRDRSFSDEGLPGSNDPLNPLNALRNLHDRVQGAIRPREGLPAQSYGMNETDIPAIDANAIVASNVRLATHATVQNFLDAITSPRAVPGETQVAINQLALLDDPGNQSRWDGQPGVGPAAGTSAWPEPGQTPTQPYFERMPFDSASISDWYYRPVYRNMVFQDAVIPKGLNALFINCWFIGVTKIEAYEDNVYEEGGTNNSPMGVTVRLWNEYGKMTRTATGAPHLVEMPDGREAILNPTAAEFPMLPASALSVPIMVTPGNGARLPLDRGDVPVSREAGFTNLSALPAPLVLPNTAPVLVVGLQGTEANGAPIRTNLQGRRVVSTKWLSNNVRFHDCTFVGSIAGSVPRQYTSVRNKVQFTGKTRIINTPERLAEGSELRSQVNSLWDDRSERLNPSSDYMRDVRSSTMMLPNYSVDIGSFTSNSAGIVELRGATIAGVLDVRGTADLEGSILLTFNPLHGRAPMQAMDGTPIGNPALFNTTLGYFGPNQGDQESLDPNSMPIGTPGPNGEVRRIAGWDTNGDGVIDVAARSPTDTAPPGTGVTPIFFSYGRINLRFNPRLGAPNGLRLPLRADAIAESYREARGGTR